MMEWKQAPVVTVGMDERNMGCLASVALAALLMLAANTCRDVESAERCADAFRVAITPVDTLTVLHSGCPLPRDYVRQP